MLERFLIPTLIPIQIGLDRGKPVGIFCSVTNERERMTRDLDVECIASMHFHAIRTVEREICRGTGGEGYGDFNRRGIMKEEGSKGKRVGTNGCKEHRGHTRMDHRSTRRERVGR